jgi:putative ABC transport system permease protein
VGKDLPFALRMLLKTPAFTLMAAIALALGIGANTAIFSVVNAVMLQRLPFENPDRLAMVWESSPSGFKTNVVNPLNFLDWQTRNHSFERIATMVEFDTSLAGEGEPEVVHAMAISDGYFAILGVQPILGRWFTPQEDVRGSDFEVILSEDLWRRRYAADPHILGRHIRFSNQDDTVVGVMAAGFRFPQTQADLWTPLALERARSLKSGRYLMTVARLKPGATISAAQADMNVLSSQLQKERPDFNTKWGITVVGLREQAIGDVRTPLLVLLGAVGLVLLIACANVANLMLMRAAGRNREIAVRVALGAGGLRIARQLLVESVLLSTIGGAAGLLIGLWATKLLTAALPGTIAYASLKTIHIDATVFLFAAAVSLVTGILFGLAPAFKAGRVDMQESLKDGGRSVVGGRSLIRSTLVVAEVALSMMLLVGAGLLIRSFARLAAVNPGFDAPHVLSMQVSVGGRFKTDTQLLGFNTQLLERVRELPGVEAAGITHFLPLGRIIPGTGFYRADRPQPAPGEEPVTEVLCVMPGYFAAMNIPLERGRVFTDEDRAGAPQRLVINQTLARQFFPNEDPIGKHLKVWWGPVNAEIIGVVGDVRQAALGKDPKPGLFLPTLQFPTSPVNLVVRTHGDPKQLSNAIQAQVHSLDHDLPISDVKTMDEYVSSSVSSSRFNTILLAAFAALALLMACVGIFGVVSYSVAQRTREIGVRRALGANAGSVMRLVLTQGMTLSAIGVAIGLVGAFAVTRVLSSLLFGVTPTDSITFIGVAVILTAVAFLASFLPARRAAKVDPMVALRYE